MDNLIQAIRDAKTRPQLVKAVTKAQNENHRRYYTTWRAATDNGHIIDARRSELDAAATAYGAVQQAIEDAIAARTA